MTRSDNGDPKGSADLDRHHYHGAVHRAGRDSDLALGGIFSPGAADSMFGKAKPGFDDNLSRLTLILAVTMFVLTAVVTYMP